MLLLEDVLAILHILPLLILVLLMGLELGVALIQAYVFTILTCVLFIYLFLINSKSNFDFSNIKPN
jgi:F0F1-type ATP synthase membrane subunit a